MKNFIDFAIEMGEQAGEIIRTNFVPHMKFESKEDGSPLTITDTRINRLIIDEVHKEYPEHNILGEEESDQSHSSEYLWVCDPIDGTIPFSHGLPISTFSLALLKDGVPIVGVIANPFTNRLYSAEQGKGTFCNGASIAVSDMDSLETAMVATEYWQQAPYKALKLVEVLEGMDCHVPILKSIAISGSLVADGQMVGLVFPGNTSWDIAAAKIIVEEAGGMSTDLFGEEQRYDADIRGAILSNGRVHEELVRLVGEHVLKSN